MRRHSRTALPLETDSAKRLAMYNLKLPYSSVTPRSKPVFGIHTMWPMFRLLSVSLYIIGLQRFNK